MSGTLAALIASGLGVGQISDAFDELGLPNNAGGGYRRLGASKGTAFGRAFTLRQVVAQPGVEAVVRQGEAALTLAQPGDILVIDADLDIATWGEGHTLRALTNRLHGVVLYGSTRDAEALEGYDLPLLCRGVTPKRSKGRLHTAGIGEVLTIGGVTISPGDLVALSSDGIAAVSPEHEERVLAKAAEILAIEQKRDDDFTAALRGAAG